MQALFDSIFLGGFECSSHRRRDGRRLDLLKATAHDRLVLPDYRALRRHGLTAARDGIRWHAIEQTPGHYDWSGFLPMLQASRQAPMQVIWDLCHYGYPDGLDIWSPRFIERYAAFCRNVARLVRDHTDGAPCYCPMNEISFWAWAGGDMALFNPAATRRGMELKRQLVRASLAAIDALRDVDKRVRLVQVDPVIHVAPRSSRTRRQAEHARLAQYEAWYMLTGELEPELGGRPECLDILGLNYYSNNQWRLRGGTIAPDHPQYRPFRALLAETHERFQRPMLIAETGAEGDRRVPWLRYICDEVRAACEAGVPIGGICLYPVTDYPGWDDGRHCEAGLLGLASEDGTRPVHRPLAREITRQQRLFSAITPCAS